MQSAQLHDSSRSSSDPRSRAEPTLLGPCVRARACETEKVRRAFEPQPTNHRKLAVLVLQINCIISLLAARCRRAYNTFTTTITEKYNSSSRELAICVCVCVSAPCGADVECVCVRDRARQFTHSEIPAVGCVVFSVCVCVSVFVRYCCDW